MQNVDVDVDVDSIIEARMEEIKATPAGQDGRRLMVGGMGEEAHDALLRNTMLDIAQRISPDVLSMLPAIALDQWVTMSVSRGHDTAGLLKSLMNSFLVAYITPETSDQAFKHLEELEALRRKVADSQERPITH